MSSHSHGRECSRCGGAPTRAVRTRRIDDREEAACYLAYIWSCSVCGTCWTDEDLEELNTRTERTARIRALGVLHETRKAS